MASSGPSADTLAGDIVSVVVPPDGPYGMIFTADSDGCAAVITGFEKLPNGKFGPIQRDGGIHIGDVLFEINDNSLMNRKFDEATKMIADRNVLRKVFKFVNSKDYYRKKRGISSRAAPTDSKNSFMSTIKRTRLTDINGKKVAEYEIACQLRTASEKVQKEIIYQWSVWKRFSAFEQLHRELKRTLGWRLDSIDFPSAHTLAMGKLSPEFITTRRDELKDYWHKIVAIDKVTDFAKHHCSAEIKDFLEVEANMKKEVAASSDMIEESAADAKESAGAGTPPNRRMSSRVTSTRRLSVRQTSIKPDDSSPASKPSADAVPSPEPPVRPNSPSPPPPPAAAPAAAERSSTPPPPPPPRPAPPAAPAAAASAPPPPARPAAPMAAPAAAAPSGGSIPPKATGARANLLGSIAALRKD